MDLERISLDDKKRILDDFFSKPKKVLLRLFILIMLLEREEHGYTIKKKIEQNTLKTWVPSNYLVYGELNQLEENGLVISFEEHKGDIPLKKYRITKKGKKELFIMGVSLLSIFDFGEFGLDIEFPLRQDGLKQWLNSLSTKPVKAQVEQLEKVQRATEMFLVAIKNKLFELKNTETDS
ncbi:MAG: PadR family transcriptional regulator [Candidatus Odinarchaeia archaeon]